MEFNEENENTSKLEKEEVHNQDENFSEIEAYLEQLEKAKKQASEEGNYIEADKYREKIEELRKTLGLKKKKNLMIKHESEMNALEEKYNKDQEELNNIWDMKIKEFVEKSMKIEAEMDSKHQEELENFVKALEQSINTTIKYPPEYHNLKRSEALLAKQQRFKEADFAKQKRLEIEKQTEEKFSKGKNTKANAKIEKEKNRQKLEKAALKKKFLNGKDLLEKEKQLSLYTLEHKFKNTRQELEIQQNQEAKLINNDNLMKKRTVTGKMPSKSALNYLNKTNFDVKFNSSGSKFSPGKKSQNFDEANHQQDAVSNHENNEEADHENNEENDQENNEEDNDHKNNVENENQNEAGDNEIQDSKRENKDENLENREDHEENKEENEEN